MPDTELMISADDHIDLGYLPSDLWQARVPAELRERTGSATLEDAFVSIIGSEEGLE